MESSPILTLTFPLLIQLLPLLGVHYYPYMNTILFYTVICIDLYVEEPL